MSIDDRLSTSSSSSSSPPPSSPSRHSSSAASQISGDEADDYSVKVEVLTLYVRAACDNLKYGACPCCQRIFMQLMLKVSQGGKCNRIVVALLNIEILSIEYFLFF